MDDLISRAAAIDAIVSATAFPDADYIKNLCQNPPTSPRNWGLSRRRAYEQIHSMAKALSERYTICA